MRAGELGKDHIATGQHFHQNRITRRRLPATLTNANGLTDLCVVARCADKNTELGLNWIEFQP
jgi:hypothetical protein